MFTVKSPTEQFQESIESLKSSLDKVPEPAKSHLMNLLKAAYFRGQVDALENSVKTVANICVANNVDYDKLYGEMFDNLVRSAASGTS